MYQRIEPWRFALAATIVAAPAAFLERSDERWAWRYVVLILLMMAIANWRGLEATSKFVRRELGG